MINTWHFGVNKFELYEKKKTWMKKKNASKRALNDWTITTAIYFEIGKHLINKSCVDYQVQRHRNNFAAHLSWVELNREGVRIIITYFSLPNALCTSSLSLCDTRRCVVIVVESFRWKQLSANRFFPWLRSGRVRTPLTNTHRYLYGNGNIKTKCAEKVSSFLLVSFRVFAHRIVEYEQLKKYF